MASPSSSRNKQPVVIAGGGIGGLASALALARTVHQNSNVMPLGEANGELRIGSAMTVVEFRNEKQRLYGALVEHRLRRKGDTFEIAHKRVDLVNSEGELDGIAILL